jgi:hypothetical protein
MPHHERVELSGTVGDVFAHRFVLETADGKVLADLGPKGAEKFRPKTGDRVQLEGESKPSEIKVHSITREGDEPVLIGHRKPMHEDAHEHAFADPKIAVRAAEKAGYYVVGEAQRKPKHFELRARDAKGNMVELHIELDGHIRKEKKAK